MTKEQLKEHCEKQVKMCEEWAKGNGREPSGKIYEEHKLILDLINALEQQENRGTPTQSWIPVSERLPNLDDYTGSEVWQEKVLITGYLSFDDTKSLFVSEAFAKDIICNRVHDTIVIAWQPLPKPYEEKRGDNNVRN